MNDITKDFQWVRSCINSSQNYWQIDSSHTLILLFKVKYRLLKEMDTMYDDLLIALTERETSLSVDA